MSQQCLKEVNIKGSSRAAVSQQRQKTRSQHFSDELCSDVEIFSFLVVVQIFILVLYNDIFQVSLFSRGERNQSIDICTFYYIMQTGSKHEMLTVSLAEAY